jgi:hypothetical protein
VIAHSLAHCRRYRVRIADVTIDVTAGLVPHHDIMTRIAQPSGDFPPDARRTAGHES